MICAKRPWTLRVSASTSGVSSFSSGSASNSPTRYGSSETRFGEPDPVQPADEDAQRPVGDPDHLVDDRDRPDLVDVVPARRLDRRVACGDEREQPVAGDDVVDQLDRALLPDRERRHRLREDDRLLERQHRQRRRQLDLRLEVGRCVEAQVASSRAPPRSRRGRAARGLSATGSVIVTIAVLVARLRALGVDVLRQPDLPLERAVLDLHLLVDARRRRSAARRSPAIASVRSPTTIVERSPGRPRAARR